MLLRLFLSILLVICDCLIAIASKLRIGPVGPFDSFNVALMRLAAGVTTGLLLTTSFEQCWEYAFLAVVLFKH